MIKSFLQQYTSLPHQWLQTFVFGNMLEAYLYAGLIWFITFLGLWVFRQIILSRVHEWALKTQNKWDDLFLDMVRGISGSFYFLVSVLVATQALNMPGFLSKCLTGALIILFVFEIVQAVKTLIDGFFERQKNRKNAMAVEGVKLVAQIMLWSVGFLLIMSNLGVDITALAASMGIGGIAVALAAQNILSDLFSSFSIYFDKPFEIGDYIVVGSNDGVVEKVGLKSTRIRTLQGEELVISNQELTGARVQNFKKMKQRRVVFSLGFEYNTPSVKLKKIPALIQKVIEAHELAIFNQVHFASFDDWALRFDIVYYVGSPDYVDYMNVQQAINFDIKAATEKLGVSMAFPTQTVVLDKS